MEDVVFGGFVITAIAVASVGLLAGGMKLRILFEEGARRRTGRSITEELTEQSKAVTAGLIGGALVLAGIIVIAALEQGQLLRPGTILFLFVYVGTILVVLPRARKRLLRHYLDAE